MSEFLGGPEGSYPEAEAVSDELFRMKEELCPPPGPADLRIQLVLDIPGPLWAVDYEGVRKGSFSSTKRMMAMTVAIPPELSIPEIRKYLGDALAETIDLAKSYVKRRKVALSTGALERAINELIVRLRSHTSSG